MDDSTQGPESGAAPPERLLCPGDRVRFRDSYVGARGVIIEQLTRDYVRVRWDGVAAPVLHRRQDLQLDERAPADGAG